MFKVRLRSSIILMVVALTTILLGGNILFAIILAISLIGMMELYRAIGLHKTFMGFMGYSACIVLDLLILFKCENWNVLLFNTFLISLMLVFVLTFPKYKISDVSIIFFGLFYVAMMLSFIYKVRMVNDGHILVWLIFIGAWGSDTCAYLVGITIGKHKFLPKLSPNKSLEGCIGGVVGATLLGLIYATVFKDSIHGVSNPQVAYALICGTSSVISQLGDLASSAIKRNYELKDFGTLIPGHGGILDRFDSIIFIAPIVYALSEIL